MFFLVKRLLKLGTYLINELLCLYQSIPSIFVSLAFVHINSVLLYELVVSNIVSLKCHLCTLKPTCRNKMMESDFNFLTSFLLSTRVTKSSTYISSLTYSTTSQKPSPQWSK